MQRITHYRSDYSTGDKYIYSLWDPAENGRTDRTGSTEKNNGKSRKPRTKLLYYPYSKAPWRPRKELFIFICFLFFLEYSLMIMIFLFSVFPLIFSSISIFPADNPLEFSSTQADTKPVIFPGWSFRADTSIIFLLSFQWSETKPRQPAPTA